MNLEDLRHQKKILPNCRSAGGGIGTGLEGGKKEYKNHSLWWKIEGNCHPAQQTRGGKGAKRGGLPEKGKSAVIKKKNGISYYGR